MGFAIITLWIFDLGEAIEADFRGRVSVEENTARARSKKRRMKAGFLREAIE